MAVPKAEVERRIEGFVEFCREQGIKVTHQRMEVFREVVTSADHPDADTVYRGVRQRMPSIARDTVYRTLAALEEEGFIRRAEVLGGPARFDANTDRHHHFVCNVCGAITDFYSEALDRLPIPRRVRSMGRIESAQVQVRGVCAACMARQEE